MNKKEIEMIVEKANIAFVGAIAYRIKARTVPQVEYLADVYGGKHEAYENVLQIAGVDLDDCGLYDIKEAYRRAKNSIILDGIDDKSLGGLE